MAGLGFDTLCHDIVIKPAALDLQCIADLAFDLEAHLVVKRQCTGIVSFDREMEPAYPRLPCPCIKRSEQPRTDSLPGIGLTDTNDDPQAFVVAKPIGRRIQKPDQPTRDTGGIVGFFCD